MPLIHFSVVESNGFGDGRGVRLGQHWCLIRLGVSEGSAIRNSRSGVGSLGVDGLSVRLGVDGLGIGLGWNVVADGVVSREAGAVALSVAGVLIATISTIVTIGNRGGVSLGQDGSGVRLSQNWRLVRSAVAHRLGVGLGQNWCLVGSAVGHRRRVSVDRLGIGFGDHRRVVI